MLADAVRVRIRVRLRVRLRLRLRLGVRVRAWRTAGGTARSGAASSWPSLAADMFETPMLRTCSGFGPGPGSGPGFGFGFGFGFGLGLGLGIGRLEVRRQLGDPADDVG